ncbi:hypothetical protein RCH23_003323 [Cryobacterium sp. CAN_C3]|uniref:hypothetical protein n=1 Tax=unclassified Cryobacterium TaxID=2649013 RepID=UPI0018C9D360|nr:hypothetical protein [Cryobacterium sp. CAN_C3]MEC5155920.1 hypothetical protein [Cryobacterium sp. CAN_C3]
MKITDASRAFELTTRPIHPDSRAALDKRWNELPPHVKADNQLPAASGGLLDGAFSSYVMSAFDDWQPAWTRMRALLHPGGRACIVDMQLPVGAVRVFRPLVRLATAVGGAILIAQPWTVIEREGVNVQSASVRGGHIRVVAGTML